MAFQVTMETMFVFFALLLLGFAAGRLGVIRAEFMGQLAQLVTKIFLPALIFYSTVSSVTLEMARENIVLLPLSAAVYAALALAALLLAKLLLIEPDKDRVFQFALIFGNTGFVGFPLLGAVFPGTGTLFMCMFTIVDQLLFWTYGVWLSTARGRRVAGAGPKALLSPNVIAIAAAATFVLAGISLPDILLNALGTVSRATTPLCMIYLGAMVCFSRPAAVLRRPEVYVGIAAKMVLLPVCAFHLASMAGLSAELAGCAALYVALPVMTVVPMISAQNGDEGEYATGIAVATFVACLVTIPLVSWLVL